MHIRIDNLEHLAVLDLLREHLASMEDTAPPESRHALDLSGLRTPDITFWTVWDKTELAGFGAMKKLTADHAEVKSMRTAAGYLRRGVGSRLLRHIICQAKRAGFSRLSLETGSMAFFAPARAMYLSHGFEPCPPFGHYVEDPNSVFLTLDLQPLDLRLLDTQLLNMQNPFTGPSDPEKVPQASSGQESTLCSP